MIKKISVEAENLELVLKNSHGDIAIIPANKREWVKERLSSGCHECIDELVSTLPKMEDYAQDGTLFPSSNEPISLITPSGRRIETTTEDDFYRTHYNQKLIGKQRADGAWELLEEIDDF